MALIFDNINNTNPQVHVFIIGVGGYKFLSGGNQERAQSFNQIGVLKQLTSPPKSALEFRDAILEINSHTGVHFQQPLGSVELLISPAPQDPNPGKNGEVFEPATINNIRTAYNNWKTRCDTHEDNVAIFFYCGHGVEKMDHYLLAEDFGENPGLPWLGSFAFDKTRRAFHSCRAKTQCFFIDSCREVTGTMLNFDLPDIPLDIPNFNVSDCQHDLTIKSSAHNERAHGPKKKPSYFTQALLKAFKGYAANKQDGDWLVKTADVASRIHDILGIVKPGQEQRQRFINNLGTPITLLKHDTAPLAHLSISCNPKEAIAKAAFRCTNLNNNTTETRQEPKPEPWKLDVQAGVYELSANFQDNGFNNCNEFVPVIPPITQKSLDCL
ncbi:caspase family protein [uncultured Lacinutrix sp.]|uniref:caspase family protein n=1 Tax=uncultured Lacinutrix sp. TaxID=574032 RepID=UPI00262D1325|nr:caspase family protein [uncultured Lacinutrix sp.]